MRSAWGVLRHWVDLALIEAVRSGAPQPRAWSFGLRAVSVVGVLAFLLAACLALISPVLRATTTLAVGANGFVIPSWSAPLLMWVLVVAMAMAATAIVHLHPVLRLLGVLVLVGTMVPFTTGLADRPGLAMGLLGGAGATLLAMIVVRWRAHFHPLEFGVAAVAVSLGTMVPMILATQSQVYGVDSRPMYIEGVLLTFTTYAIPLMLVAGFALAQVTIRLATDLGPSVVEGRRSQDAKALYVVLGILAVAQIGLWAWAWMSQDASVEPEALLAGGMLIALFVILAGPLWVRARSVGFPPVAELDEGYSQWLYPIALAMMVINLPIMIASVATGAVALVAGPEAATPVLRWADFAFTPEAGVIWRSLVALGLVVAAWLLARRGRMAGPLVACAAAAILVMWAVSRGTGLGVGYWSAEGVAVLGVIVGTVAFVVQALRRRVDRRVLVGMVGLLAIGVAFPFRHILGEPIDHLLGLTGGALLVFGVGWQLLSGAGFTREGSRLAPAPARVLLFITNILLTTAVVAWVSLTRQANSVIDPASFADTGDWLFGTSLLIGVLVLLIVQICTGGKAAAVETREMEAIVQQVAADEWERASEWQASTPPPNDPTGYPPPPSRHPWP